jgi:hypothetical protein
VGSVYQLTLQVYTSVNDSPYVLSFVSVTPSAVTLAAAPVVPGLTTIQPVLSLALAQQAAVNVQGAILAANANSDGADPFVQPSVGEWNNSLQGVPDVNQNFLLVPCTSAYCRTQGSDSVVMLILAWPIITSLTTDQQAEIKKACPTLTNPQVSYAVYQGSQLIGNKLGQGTWYQPVPSDPTVVNTFQVVAYVWSGADNGVENSSCLSQPATVVVQTPTNLYSPEVCFKIQPLKEEGAPIPGNFMLYRPGLNMCSAPLNSEEALSVRDFSCITSQSTRTLDNLQMYGCNDVGDSSTNSCNSSGQGCLPVFPVTSVRQPGSGESSDPNCTPLPPGTVPPCGGSQYCQQAACNCPASVPWSLCGSSSFAQIGTDQAIESGRWQNRVAAVASLIKTYNLDKITDVQTFLNQTASPQNIQTAWDKTYGSSVCPLPNVPAPDSCDVTSPDACKPDHNSVCGPWKADPSNGLFKQQVFVYPTVEQQANCCANNFTFFNGCCCPNNQSASTCDELKNCVPLGGTLGPTWCNK